MRKPTGGRDQPMAVLVEDAAHHLAEREREHLVAVVVGQSGTERPELVLVTMPPAATSSSVAAASRRRSDGARSRR